jgi:hypothetical protein
MVLFMFVSRGLPQEEKESNLGDQFTRGKPLYGESCEKILNQKDPFLFLPGNLQFSLYGNQGGAESAEGTHYTDCPP